MAATASVPVSLPRMDLAQSKSAGDIQDEGEGSELDDVEGGEEVEPSYEDAGSQEEDIDRVGASDEDAEGEDEQDNDEDEGEFVGAVKIPQDVGSGDEEVEGSEDGLEDGAMEEDDDESRHDPSSEESDVAEEWEGDSHITAEEAELRVENRNNCVFCNQDEDHDPSEDYEEYMACAVCGDNAHPQCARDAASLAEDAEPKEWRCPSCVNNNLRPERLEEQAREDEQPKKRRRSSEPKLTRDLLPAHKPGTHSVFGALILDDDPLDGSRSLRKRKSSELHDIEPHSSAPSKRQKRLSNEQVLTPGESAAATAGAQADQEVSLQSSRPSRLRQKKKEAEEQEPEPRLRIIEKTKTSFLISIRAPGQFLRSLKRKRKNGPIRPPRPPSHPHFAPSSSSHHMASFYSLKDRENDEAKAKPYGGVLTETEADTGKTFPLDIDRIKFEEALERAEKEWKIKTAAEEALSPQKKQSSKAAALPSNIRSISFGHYEIDTWYASPYPLDYTANRVLYICEFCLKYMPSDFVAFRHKLKCPVKHPPGDEIYRDKSVSVFEVDGRKNPLYCKNLCLLAKLFLGSKTLYYDVEPFLFYILTEYDDYGFHFVGYFSKEKRPASMNNVSCILTLPIHQRKGYGNLLIDFSYLLTRVEGKTGSPEKPLSDMGLVSYRNYWRLVLSRLLLKQETEKTKISVPIMSQQTGMTADDIISTLEALRALVRDPVTKTYALRLNFAYFKETIEKWEGKKYVKLTPDSLVWTPYLMGRSHLTNFDRAPPIATVAPRDHEEEPQSSTERQGESTSTGLPKVNGVAQAFALNGNTQPTDTITPLTLEDSRTTTSLPTRPLATIEPNLAFSSRGGTPKVENLLESIPPTRYEIFPAIPGVPRSRKGGPKSTSRNKRNSFAGTTPGTAKPTRINGERQGKGKNFADGKGKAPGTPSSRVTRSRANGDEDNVNGEETETANEEATETTDADGDNVMEDTEADNVDEEEEHAEKDEDDGDEEYEEDVDEDAEGEDDEEIIDADAEAN